MPTEIPSKTVLNNYTNIIINLSKDPENFTVANPIATPNHIQSE